MKSAHKVKAYRNNTDTAGKAAFLGSYLTKETIAIEKLCEQTAAQSGLTAIQVRAILEGSFDAIAELEKEGLVIVHLDGLTVMAVITGSFPTSDAPFDGERNALELAIRLDDDIRLAFVNETAQMVTDATMARVRIDNVMDLDAPRPMNIIHGVKPFRVAGFNMVMDDEGAEVYLQNPLGVTFPVTVDEVASTQLFTAHVAAAVEPGDYKLVVKSRGGDPEGVLQTTFRKVKYLHIDEALRISSVNSDGMENGHFSRDQPVCIGGKGLADGFEKLVITYTGEGGSPMTMIIEESELAALSDSEIKVGENIWTDTPYPKGAVTFTVHAGGKTASAEATPE